MAPDSISLSGARNGKRPLKPRRASKRRAKGAEALSDAELLAALIAEEGEGEANDLAETLLLRWGDLFTLPGTTREMLRHEGVDDRQATRLLAAAELGRRLAEGEVQERKPLTRPEEVARYLTLRYGRRDQEIMGALFLDVRHGLLSESEAYRGTLHRAAVEPREILKECLIRGAAGVVLFHTHPSGDPTPSSEDVLFSRRMALAAEIVGVELVDHLVLGNAGRYVSLRRRGAW
jgi:DNA repair protein RadC